MALLGTTSTAKPQPHYNEKAVASNSTSRFQWSFPIKYCFEEGTSKDNVTLALREIESHTCINFTESSNCSILDDGIYFKERVEESYGCSYSKRSINKNVYYAHLSYKCTQNSVLLQKLIFEVLGIVFHEYHNNRDYHITLNRTTANEFKRQYEANYSVNYGALNVSYDFGSMMHSHSKIGNYHNYTFITAKRENLTTFYNKMMGQHYKTTFTDWKTINGLYCTGFCKKNTCKNDGYPHPRNCSKCVCPDGFVGDLCKRIESTSSTCNIVVHNATEQKKFLFHSGKNDFTYQLKASNDKFISITLKDMESKDMTPCYSGSGLEIKYLRYKGLTGLCLCGKNTNIRLTSEGNTMLIRYKGTSDDDYFVLKYKEVPRKQSTSKQQQSSGIIRVGKSK
uniref:ZnMc domain-containing protein n=1 Tax=Parastrongyloides trichosuri TaxID=131310 RepID=A0A0N4ZZX5_PARTI